MSRVALRHSLVTRLLVISVLIAVLAVAATAWLATRTATQAIRQEQGRSLSDEKALYDALIDHAATERDWSGVQPLLAEYAGKLGRRITLTTEDLEIVAESSTGPDLAETQPSATIDPLQLDLTLTGGTDKIDSRVLGPYQIPADEARDLEQSAALALRCMTFDGVEAEMVTASSGRPMARVTGEDSSGQEAICLGKNPSPIAPAERRALRELGRLVAKCVGSEQRTFVTVPKSTLASSVLEDQKSWFTGGSSREARTCLEQARRTQLRPYPAAPVQLFVTDPDTGQAGTTFTLSGSNVARIAWVTGGVLLLTILMTVLLGRRLVRPLRALTEAAARQEPVNISTRDEIGYLAQVLNDSRERRDRAEAQRRAMVGDVAHELRNPLTNIRSWLEAAQDGLTPTDRALLDLLHDETMLLQHVIADLADLAAADAGTLHINPEPVDLSDVLAQVRDAHVGPAEAAGVALGAAVQGESTITADPVRLRQLIGNLVSNAIRYTPRGGVVKVTTTSIGNWLELKVEDTGTGIAEDDLPKVFDRFWRADESRTRASGGSGLGLSIARQIADLHGGTITVESRLGHGTTFTVRLPLGRSESLR
ncbi:sensor histidine kinase [Kineosporia babensis]|uniref:histidine kinase n=1 Tax=Kineosporia babensis TaxID=499548 RepID=A0A9X1NLY3_9ACTN|nr:HAMP domain-containing sensor histidine kinase [Kineosporia babensis]MCD5316214.1 ATP-binding protein [Kineosporia babensis]